MAILEIKKYPERVLSKKADDIESIDAHLQHLIDDMVETMYAAPGIGLAAPQIGVSKRLAVIDISTKESPAPLIVIINPVITHMEGTIEFEEGCLSLPEYTTKIQRARKIMIRAFDRNGELLEIVDDGLLAIALQHELDHLDGVLLIDRISPLKREFFKKRHRKSVKLAR